MHGKGKKHQQKKKATTRSIPTPISLTRYADELVAMPRCSPRWEEPKTPSAKKLLRTPVGKDLTRPFITILARLPRAGKWYMEAAEAFELSGIEAGLEYLVAAMTTADAHSEGCHAVITTTSYYQYKRVFDAIHRTLDRVRTHEANPKHKLLFADARRHGVLDMGLDMGPRIFVGRDRKPSNRIIQVRVRAPGVTIGDMMRNTWALFEEHDRNVDCESMRFHTVPTFVYGHLPYDHPLLLDIDRSWLYEHPLDDVAPGLKAPHGLDHHAKKLSMITRGCPTVHYMSIFLALAEGRVTKAVQLAISAFAEKSPEYNDINLVIHVPDVETQRQVFRYIYTQFATIQYREREALETELKRTTKKENRRVAASVWGQVISVARAVAEDNSIKFKYVAADPNLLGPNCGFFRVERSTQKEPKLLYLKVISEGQDEMEWLNYDDSDEDTEEDEELSVPQFKLLPVAEYGKDEDGLMTATMTTTIDARPNFAFVFGSAIST